MKKYTVLKPTYNIIAETKEVTGTPYKLDKCDLDFVIVKEKYNYVIYELHTGLLCYNGEKSIKTTIENFEKTVTSNKSIQNMLKDVKNMLSIDEKIKNQTKFWSLWDKFKNKTGLELEVSFGNVNINWLDKKIKTPDRISTYEQLTKVYNKEVANIVKEMINIKGVF